MDNSTKNSREVVGFLEQWKKHPMSIPIIILMTTSTFLLVLIQGGIDDKKIIIAAIFCLFSFLLFLVVVAVLVWRKFVFYNATELVIVEVDRYIRNIHESLSDVEIGYGMAFDHLRAPPISSDISDNISNFELLSNILKHIDYKFDGDDSTKKALAKYYFRIKKYQKGLEWIEQVSDKKGSEYNFIKGLLLWKLTLNEKSRECFDKSEHQNAKYYKYLTYVSFDMDHSRNDFDTYINEANKESSPLYSNFFAQLNISTSYQQKAFKFPSNGQIVDCEMLRLAFANAERLFPRDDYGFAHYNAACYLSLMAKYKVDIDSERKFDETSYRETIIKYLDTALNTDFSLVKHAIVDVDFEWIKEVYGKTFFEIIGRHYERCLRKK